jgi:hypothetical protein
MEKYRATVVYVDGDQEFLAASDGFRNGYGNTEDEALANFAIKNNLLLWSEEGYVH